MFDPLRENPNREVNPHLVGNAVTQELKKLLSTLDRLDDSTQGENTAVIEALQAALKVMRGPDYKAEPSPLRATYDLKANAEVYGAVHEHGLIIEFLQPKGMPLGNIVKHAETYCKARFHQSGLDQSLHEHLKKQPLYSFTFSEDQRYKLFFPFFISPRTDIESRLVLCAKEEKGEGLHPYHVQHKPSLLIVAAAMLYRCEMGFMDSSFSSKVSDPGDLISGLTDYTKKKIGLDFVSGIQAYRDTEGGGRSILG